jgi:DNA helicase-2/ATP-dependent DNA helicase PcrA
MTETIKLSPKQQEAVDHVEGAILIKAGAGSGKTRVLTERIKKLLPTTKRKILAITFTNKAGEEMGERLQGVAEIKKRLFIGTFHGFCQQVIENNRNLLGFQEMPHIFEDESDRLRLVEEAIELTPSYYHEYEKQKDLKSKRDFCYRALGFISKIKRDRCGDLEGINKLFEDENVALFYDSYKEILESQNAIDFDDLILLAYQLFSTNSGVASLYRRNYEYICVDEAQDLNKAQYQLLLALTNGTHKNVLFVGDPNQSIFAFTGSSAEFMSTNFVKDFNPKIIELTENYRSSIQVVEAAKKIMPEANHVTNAVLQGDFKIYAAKDEEDEANWVLQKIGALIKEKNRKDIEGDITYEKITILARTKYVLKQIEVLFKEHGIPYYYKITPGAIKFETKTMKLFDLALRVKLNAYDKLHLGQLINLAKVDKKVTNITELIVEIEEETSKKILELVDALKEDGSNLKKLFRRFKEWLIKEKAADDNGRKMLMDEVDEVCKHWSRYAKKTDNKSLHRFKSSMALGQTHSLAQSNGIALSTIHTMKGQQNEIIFVVGMDQGTFPYYKAINKGGIEMVQERNNAYVAFTRAKRLLYVSWPENRKMPWGDIKHREESIFLEPFAKN